MSKIGGYDLLVKAEKPTAVTTNSIDVPKASQLLESLMREESGDLGGRHAEPESMRNGELSRVTYVESSPSESSIENAFRESADGNEFSHMRDSAPTYRDLTQAKERFVPMNGTTHDEISRATHSVEKYIDRELLDSRRLAKKELTDAMEKAVSTTLNHGGQLSSRLMLEEKKKHPALDNTLSTAGNTDKKKTDELDVESIEGNPDESHDSPDFIFNNSVDTETRDDSDRSQRVGEVVDRIVEKILVSDDLKTGGFELRIELTESVMEGAEIRIIREGAEVFVTLVTKTERSKRYLEERKYEFSSDLERKLGEPVHVEVVSHDETI